MLSPTALAEARARHVQEMRSKYREEIEAARAMVIKTLTESGGEIYSVQLARLMGWFGNRGTGARGVSRAKNVLMTMEADGLLKSTLRLPKPGEGGPGRRYYRLADRPKPKRAAARGSAG